MVPHDAVLRRPRANVSEEGTAVARGDSKVEEVDELVRRGGSLGENVEVDDVDKSAVERLAVIRREAGDGPGATDVDEPVFRRREGVERDEVSLVLLLALLLGGRLVGRVGCRGREGALLRRGGGGGGARVLVVDENEVDGAAEGLDVAPAELPVLFARVPPQLAPRHHRRRLGLWLRPLFLFASSVDSGAPDKRLEELLDGGDAPGLALVGDHEGESARVGKGGEDEGMRAVERGEVDAHRRDRRATVAARRDVCPALVRRGAHRDGGDTLGGSHQEVERGVLEAGVLGDEGLVDKDVGGSAAMLDAFEEFEDEAEEGGGAEHVGDGAAVDVGARGEGAAPADVGEQLDAGRFLA